MISNNISIELLILLICSIQLTSSNQTTCNAICGQAEEDTESQTDFGGGQEVKKAEESDKKTRIVNGWNSKPRPWMVMIRSYPDPEDKEMFGTCGGAIINSCYVLTAGHCVCMQGSREVPCEGGHISYDPKQIMKLYVGLNGANVEEILGRHKDLHEYSVDSIIKHPDWDGTGYTYPDLALIKSAKPFKFEAQGKMATLPVCMPPFPQGGHHIHGQKGYVAGWGNVANDDCFTDNYGPERHAKCRFPFLYKGLEIENCMTSQTPSATNSKCKQFEKAMGKDSMPKKGESIMILYGVKRRKTICYHANANPNGWCGTCLKHAQEGEYGHCPDYMPPPEEKHLITIATPSKHWGYCSKLCKLDEVAPRQLQETRLSILHEKECTAFNSSQLIYRSTVEFCGGYKMDYPDMKIYKRYRKRGGAKTDFVFILQQTKKNTLGALKKHYQLGFYLGQTDSCQGDSGGPFYVFRGGKAFIVGVVSRGGQCAGFNQPGIYTNLMHEPWRKWILDNSQGCKC